MASCIKGIGTTSKYTQTYADASPSREYIHKTRNLDFVRFFPFFFFVLSCIT